MTLSPFLEPRSAVLVGASADPEKFGFSLLQNLVEARFPGALYGVNPRGGEALGVAFHERVHDLPEAPDLALLALPAERVLEAARPCFERGIPALAVLTSGFAETGPEGRRLQERLAREAREAGARLLGPNCLGLVRAPSRLAATFYWELPPPDLFAAREPGLSILSMSGGLGAMFLQELSRRGLPLSTFVSLGNCADLGPAEFLGALEDDPHTGAVGLFMEGQGPGDWLEAAARCGRRKPLVLLRAGRSASGMRAAIRHTGATPPAADLDERIREAGVVQAADSAHWFDLLEALHRFRDRKAGSRGVAVVSNSGGACVVAADALEAAGLDVPLLGPEARARLESMIPPFGSPLNPVDTTAALEDEDCEAVMRAVLGDPAVGLALVINVGLDYPAWAEACRRAGEETGCPVVACAFDAPAMAEACRQRGVPVSSCVEAGVRMLAALAG